MAACNFKVVLPIAGALENLKVMKVDRPILEALNIADSPKLDVPYGFSMFLYISLDCKLRPGPEE